MVKTTRSKSTLKISFFYFVHLQVTVNETMLNHENQIKLKEKRIPFKAGDVLGMYFPENSIINYSKYNY